MVRRDQYKYMYTHGFPGQLYDLASDPEELMNLVDKPEMAEVATQMLDDVLAGWYPELVNRRCLESQRRRHFIQKARGGEPYWAYETPSDDRTRFVRNAGAAPTKAKARFPYVEPTPFEN